MLRSRFHVLEDLTTLFESLGVHWRRRTLLLLCLTFVGASSELLVIGAIVPFLAIIADPTGSRTGGLLADFLGALPHPLGMSTLSVVATLFIIFALAAAVIRLTLSRLTFKFVYAVGHEISVAVYERIVQQPYSFHIQHNSSESVAALNRVVDITHNMILPLVQCASAGTIVLFIVTGLFVIDPVIAGSSILGFALIYLLPLGLDPPTPAQQRADNYADGQRPDQDRAGGGWAGSATCCLIMPSRSMSRSSRKSISTITTGGGITCSWPQPRASLWNRSGSSSSPAWRS